MNRRTETLRAVAELVEDIIDRIDADGIDEDDELRTLVAMFRASVFQMLDETGATETDGAAHVVSAAPRVRETDCSAWRAERSDLASELC